ncbi:MAG TPA: hypothetical protein PKD99_02225 [Sphingopyxis sp.]|nr:hypothetical protein [Sphingopyxis sp.]HMP43893.1 hypothetical protein [Sphingopyxis sp.]HMQ18506.1 hypothetical protein [Sphingopyxis sp.]
MAAPSNYRALAARAGIPFVEFACANGVGWSLDLTFEEEDLTAADIAVELRALPDLRVAATGMDVGEPALEGGDTIVLATIDGEDAEALGLAAEIGREIDLWGRVVVTPDGGEPMVWVYFKLTRLGS